MKNKFFALFFLTIIFVSCKDEPATPPAAVVDEMFSAMQQGNIENMKKHITKSDVNLLETAEKFMTSIDPEGIQKIKDRMQTELKDRSKNIQYSIKKETIDGDRATIEAEIIDNNPSEDTAKKTITQTFELVKEDNAWKIALTKPGNEMFNSMKGNMGARNGSLKDGVEKMKQMDPDSLKMLIQKGLQALDSLDKKKQNTQ